MRGILKLVGVSLCLFLLLIVLTGIFSFIRFAWFGTNRSLLTAPIHVLDVSGVIVTSSGFIKELKDALDNKSIKALVIRINSPGGIVAPSQEIYEAVKRANEKIPVVISMGSVAASGGYYIALGGRKIIANPGTMTASIGVLMEFLNTQKLYQWAKMDRFTITSGKFKDAGSPLKNMTAEEKALFQEMVNDIYSQFRHTVQERRKLTDAELDKVADGRVVTGAQALQAKLVDGLGGFEDALLEAKKLAKVSADAGVSYPEKSQGLLRKVLLGEEEEEGTSSRLWNLLSHAANQLPEPSQGPAWRLLWLSPVQ